MRLAAQYDDEEADARAARFAVAVAPTFLEAKRIALGPGTLRHRAAGLNAFEGCARSLALRLWRPQLVTRPEGDPIAEPNLEETSSIIDRGVSGGVPFLVLEYLIGADLKQIFAHMQRDPMEDVERFRAYPAALVKLMRAATARSWRDRPTPLEFGRAFVECL